MKFRKGDKVKFLNDIGQGEVVRFQDKNTAIVLNEDGFEIPVLMSELLKIEGDYSFSNTEPVEESEEEVVNESFDNDNLLDEDGLMTETRAQVFFAFVPKKQDDVLSSDLDIYLINDSNYRVFYTISKSEGEFMSLIAFGNLESNTKVKISTIERIKLSDYELIDFQLIFYSKGNYYSINPVKEKWKIKQSLFFKENSYVDNDFFHEKIFLHEITNKKNDLSALIDDSEIEKAKKEKERKDVKKQFKSSKKGKTEDIEEVDLHIEELVENFKELSKTEILDIQKSRFITALDGGIIAGTKKMVFIHGVGNGRLKHEIAKTLDRKYPKLRYQDASFKEYGYGATLVMIK